MKPVAFDYAAPGSVREAVGLLAEHGEQATVLAGGQSLGPLLNLRLAMPGVVVDINGLEDLGRLDRADDGTLRLGAMVRQRDAERSPLIREHAPAVAEALPLVGHRGIRNRGTVGGSVAHADPAAELPAVLLALGARYRLTGPDGDRWVDAADFHHGFLTTDIGPGELLTAVEVPARRAAGRQGWLEFAERHGDFAIVGVAAATDLEDGRCRRPRLALAGVDRVPRLLSGPGMPLHDARPDRGTIEDTARWAAAQVDPPGDVHATAGYRRDLVGVLTRRLLGRLLGEQAG